MTTNLQFSPYLPRQRNFPIDSAQVLGVELDKTYIEIAQRVNERTIGLFSVNLPSITGENWYLQGQPRINQTLREVYQFGPIAPGTELDIPHGILNFTQFTRIYGTVITNAPDFRPLPYIDPVTNTTGMALLVGTIANVGVIRIVLGASAQPVVSGIVILEWLIIPQNNNP